QDLSEIGELVLLDRRLDVAAAEYRLIRPSEPGPATLEPVGLVRQVGGRGSEFLLQVRDEIRRGLVDPCLVDHALGNEALRIKLADRRMLLDRRIHLRLGEARLVALIVAEAAVAPHVDDDIAVEALAELGRHLAAES